MSDLRVLIVEDEPDGAELVELMLHSVEASTVVATTAEEALYYLRETNEPFRAAIVDLALPGMDGFDLLRAIKGDTSLYDLPLIAITAFHTPELRAKAMKAGFTAYLPKPLKNDAFLDTLEQVIS
jgi:CheY-like chemotaxis protein